MGCVLTCSVAIALPMGMSGDKVPSRAPATQEILGSLDDAEKLFWADLALTARRGAAPHVREASVSLAMIRALQSSLGKVNKDAPMLAARLLGIRVSLWCVRALIVGHRRVVGDHAPSRDARSNSVQAGRRACRRFTMATDDDRGHAARCRRTTQDKCIRWRRSRRTKSLLGRVGEEVHLARPLPDVVASNDPQAAPKLDGDPHDPDPGQVEHDH